MSGGDLQRPVGVWRAIAGLGEYKTKHLVSPILLALLLGGGGAALVTRVTALPERMDTMGDVLALAGALLAVVFTALAIVVSLPSTSYLRMLEQTPEGGMRRFLDPFLVAVGVQITVLLTAIGYRLAAGDVPWWVEHGVFYVVGSVFVFGVLDVAALARQLVRHGILRAVDATLTDDDEGDSGASVRRLPGRRGN